MKRLLNIIALLLFLKLIPFGKTNVNVFAQTYPVTLNTQLTPPFTGYLQDYSAIGSEKLKVMLLFNDFSKPNYQVKLKIKIEGQGIIIQSKPYYFEGPFTIEPGIPLMLSGSDLDGLLSTSHLDFSGINPSQYDQRKVLPEGFYSICITAYDYNNPNNIVLSNTSCAYGLMVLNDPPYLNLPQCGQAISTTNPQQLIFNWTPVNQASPNSAGQTEYAFELFEIRPPGQNPNNIVQTLPPVYTETTSVSTLNYGIAATPLIYGMEYVWRVKAIDPSGRDLFKNNGYSQICTFTWGTSYQGANLNLNLSAQTLTHRQLKAQWDSIPLYQNYKLEYQKVNGTSSWFPLNTTNARSRISSLEPNTDYKLRVSGQLSDGTYGPVSNEVTVRTSPLPSYNCGETMPPINNGNFSPLTSATAGMIWDVGQFEIVVTSLQNPMSANGMYSGMGRVQVGFAGGIPFPVTFQNITVSNDMRVVSGQVDIISKGIDHWLNQQNAGYFIAGNDETEYHSNSSNPDITVNQGNGTINIDGQNVALDTEYGNTITDADGDIYAVTPDGQVINIGNEGPPIPQNQKYINTAVGKADFSPAKNQLYGYDQYQFEKWLKWYEKTTDIATQNQIPVDWKSIQDKKYDLVELNIQFNNSALKADSVFVRSASGTIYKQQKINGKRYIYFVGSEPKKSQELFAGIRMGDSIVNIGKINTINYEVKQKIVNLIPFHNNQSIDAIAIQSQLNRRYAQTLIKWIVNIKPAISIPATDWDLNSDHKLNCGSSLFAKYSNEMQAINNAVKSSNSYNSDELYIVVSGIAPDSLQSGLLGEMPRHRNIGYVFTNSNPNDSVLTQIIAHELGHGYATLEHTFPEISTGSADNLMDYPAALNMARFQWDLCQNPNGLAGVLDGTSDNTYFNNECLFDISEKYVYAPNGYIFKTPANTRLLPCMNCPAGPIYFLKVNETYYEADIPGNDQGMGLVIGAFNGYKNIEKTSLNIVYKTNVPVNEKVYFTNILNGKLFLYEKSNLSSFGDDQNKMEINSSPMIENFINSGATITSSCVINLPDLTSTQIQLFNKYKNFTVKSETYIYEQNNLITLLPNGKEYIRKFSPEQFQQLKSALKQDKLNAEEVLIYEKTSSGYRIYVNYGVSVSAKYGGKESKDNSEAAFERVINNYLKDKNDLAQLHNQISSQNFEDGKKIDIKQSNIWDLISNGIKATKEFLQDAEIKPKYWNSQDADYSNNWINTPPTLSGCGNGVIEEVKEIPQLVVLAAEIATDKNVRDTLWNKFKGLTIDKLKTAALDAINNWTDTYAQGGDPAWHQGGKDAVMVFSMLSPAGLLKNTDDAIEKNLDDITTKVKKKADEVTEGARDIIFSSAREYVRSKYGQEILNQLTTKFGTNDGAAAVILQKWGDDGLTILNKSYVNNLDDAAKELVINKTMYRYVNETSYNFEKLKTQGLIDASPSQFPGYATLDKIDDAIQAQSILQLPKKPTWVAEFSSSQIINDVRFPTAKFNNANYIEVLTRSYPEWGIGGGSQFISNSQIKITKLRNLTTGEIITFP